MSEPLFLAHSIPLAPLCRYIDSDNDSSLAHLAKDFGVLDNVKLGGDLYAANQETSASSVGLGIEYSHRSIGFASDTIDRESGAYAPSRTSAMTGRKSAAWDASLQELHEVSEDICGSSQNLSHFKHVGMDACVVDRGSVLNHSIILVISRNCLQCT